MSGMDTAEDAIAIVGAAGKFPGAPNLEAFWKNLRDGVESISRFSIEEMRSAGCDPDMVAHPDYVPCRGVVGAADNFDAGFFGFSPREAELADPQQRLFMETVWEALENASVDPERADGPIGLYCGSSAPTYIPPTSASTELSVAADGYGVLFGNQPEYLATRTSYKLDLRGPSLAVNTACSTSLVATVLACQSLANGDCSIAIAGGACITYPDKGGHLYQEAGIMSPDGHCRTFDADSQGTVSGNGVGVVVLKRLQDALDAGDTILALIRGYALNNDGARKIGFTAPGVEGQATVIREALGMAGISADSVSYVEAHGTGTHLGDPIEVQALTRAYRSYTGEKQFCALGSVKTNIGHLDAAAGVAGLIKAALSLSHAQIPPSLHFSRANPRIDFESSPFFVNDRLRDWASQGPRRAGVSSFGIGGTNAHVVLEEAPARAPGSTSRVTQLLTLSARSPAALENAAARLASYLEHNESPLPDVAYTLAVGRKAFGYRCAISCGTRDEAIERLGAVGKESAQCQGQASVALLLAGDNPLNLQAARDLYEQEVGFRDVLDRASRHLQGGLGFDLCGALLSGDVRQLESLRVQEAAKYLVHWALVKLYESGGVHADVAAGSGLGELAAATTAGVWKEEDAWTVAALRGEVLHALAGGEDEQSARAKFVNALAAFPRSAPRLRYLSGVLGTWAGDEVTAAEFWWNWIRQPARAAAALRELAGPSQYLWLDLSIDPLPTQSRFIGTLGSLWVAGATVDWNAYYRSERRNRIPLPTYPFEKRRYSLRAAVSTSTSQQKDSERMTRQQSLARRLREIWAKFLGTSPEQVSTTATFFELGLDSLLLMQVTRVIKDEFGVKLPFRKMIEEFTCIEALATHLDATIPANLHQPAASSAANVPPPKAVEATPPPATPPVSVPVVQPVIAEISGPPQPQLPSLQGPVGVAAGAAAAPEIRDLLSEQLRILAMQLELLTGRSGANAPAAAPTGSSAPTALPTVPAVSTSLAAPAAPLLSRVPAAPTSSVAPIASSSPAAPTASLLPTAPAASLSPAAPATAQSAKPAAPEPEVFVPHRPARPNQVASFDARQQQHLEEFTARYNRRTAKTKAHIDQHRRAFADNRAIHLFRLQWKDLVYPIVGERSRGARMWDLDGNEYVDFTMGFGVHMFGHSPSFIHDAVRAQLDSGVQIGPQSHLAGEVSEALARLTGMERFAYCNSGTEAVMIAVRLARATTGRNRIVTFAGSYHGTYDGTLVRAVKGADGTMTTAIAGPGVPASVANDVTILQYDDPAALAYIRAHADEIAAVLVEPIQSRRPDIQPREFLKTLREITTERHIALIFDEVITGFRIHPGGAQAWLGIRADLVTYGKVIGGGMPIGIVAGTSEFMAGIDGGTWQFGDGSYPASDQIIYAGTFCKHPLTLAASRAVVRHLLEHGPKLQSDLNATADRFVRELNRLLESGGMALRVVNCGSLIRFLQAGPANYMDLFFFHLVEKGVYLWEGRTAFISTAHTEADLRFVLQAVERSIDELRQAGFLPARQGEVPSPRIAPATEQQKQLWALAQMSPEASRAYNESIAIHIPAPIDTDRLRRAFEYVARRHESLRTVFAEDGQSLRISADIAVDLPSIDLSADRTRALRKAEALSAEATRLFDLTRGPLWRLLAIKVSEQESALVLTAHHSVLDGWSASTVLREVSACYLAFGRGEEPALPPPMPFSQFTELQSGSQHALDATESRQFWSEKFRTGIPQLQLPLIGDRPPLYTYAGAREQHEIPAAISARIKDLAVRKGFTRFTVTLATYVALLAHVSSARELTVGVHLAGQALAGSTQLVGHCVNLVPLKLVVDRSASFFDLVGACQQALLDASEHQLYPYSQVARDLNVRRDPSRLTLVEAVFNLDRSPQGIELFGARVVAENVPTGSTKWDLSWNVVDAGGVLRVECDYNRDLYSASAVRSWLQSFHWIMDLVAHESAGSLGELLEAAEERASEAQQDRRKALQATSLERLRTAAREEVVTRAF